MEHTHTCRRVFLAALASMMLVGSLMVGGCGKTTQEQGASQQPSATTAERTEMKPGTYEGVAQGMNAPIKVEVKVSKDKIDDVKIIEQHESAGISDPAINLLPKAIVANQGVGIDGVSGATFSSLGVLSATEDALKKAGADLTVLRKVKGQIEHSKLPEQKEYDVVVIGAGGAGLSSAISAAENGASVIVVEKQAALGGNTALSGGGMAAPNNWVEQKEGIKDSVDLFYEDVMKGGDYKANPELVRELAENALPSAEWLRDNVGVEFEDYMNFFGGHTVKRSLMPKGATGTELTRKMVKKCAELKVPIINECKAEHLVKGADGRIEGVECNHVGEKVTFKAKKGVIIATGGYGANLEMREKYNPGFGKEFKSTDSLGSQGDGIKMAQEQGANLVGMEYIQTYPTCDPETGRISYVANTRLQSRAILVNKEGKRFVEELERRDVISQDILKQTDKVAWLFWDEKALKDTEVDKKYPYEFKNLLDRKILMKGDTIEDVAKQAGVDPAALKATVERYNEFCKNGKDEDFNHRGKIMAFEATGPYYLQKTAPAVHHTMGGIQIDPVTHVVDKDGKAIPGLYACGEVTGGIHGTNRLGSVAIADIVVFGKLAGANAAAGK